MEEKSCQHKWLFQTAELQHWDELIEARLDRDRLDADVLEQVKMNVPFEIFGGLHAWLNEFNKRCKKKKIYTHPDKFPPEIFTQEERDQVTGDLQLQDNHHERIRERFRKLMENSMGVLD